MTDADRRRRVAQALDDFLRRSQVAVLKCDRCGSKRIEVVHDALKGYYHCIVCGKEWGHTPLEGGPA